MLRKIVIAADSFKGSLTSAQFARVAAEAVKWRLPNCQTVEVSLGDGGEGTLDALLETMGARMLNCVAHDPLMRPVDAKFAICDDKSTAIIEMAKVSGLTLLTEDERNPMLTTTYGTGELIAKALEYGCRRIFIGIGGSATNDGGMGLLTALGYRFFDTNGNLIESYGRGCDLERVADVDCSHINIALKGVDIIVACDVDNPLCGLNGASYVFGPQKGADKVMCDRLDRGMESYAKTLYKCFGIDISQMPGAGAAGGVGGCLYGVLGAKLMSGIDMVLEAVNFRKILECADLVITGEGRMDEQTLSGKTPSGVLKAAKTMGIPVVAFCGQVQHCPELDNAGFAAVLSIQSGPCSLADALAVDVAARNLATAVDQVVNLISTYSPTLCD